MTSPPVEDPLETWLRTDIETLRPSGRLRYSLSALSIVDYGDLLAFDVRESHLHGGGKKAQELSILKQQVLSSLPKANRRDAERRALLRQRFRESMLATPDELAEHLDVSRDEVRRLLSAWPERVSRLSEDLFVWHPTSGSDDAEELLARAEGELWSAYDAELRSAAAHVDDLDTWAVAVLLSYFVHTNANGIVQHLANRLADKVRAGSEHSEVLSVPSQEDRPATKPPAAPIRRDAQPPPTPPREERPEPPTSPNDSTAERRLQERFMTNLARLDLLPWDHARQLADDVGVKDVDYVLREMTRERKLLRLPHNYFMLPTTKERIFSRWPKRERMLRKLLDGDWAACSADALFFLAIFFDRIGTEDRAVTEILNHLFSRQDVDPEIMAEVADLRFARSMEMQ